MYCSECGKPAIGKFCSHCGAKLLVDLATRTDVVEWDSIVEPDRPEWDHEVRYEMLMRVPEVRDKVQRHAGLARKGVTGEQFLELCDKVLPLGFPMAKLVSVVQPIYARLGIGTGKERAERIVAPVGRVITRVLCSLARHGQSLRNVQQAVDGCLVEAVLPSDVWALEGDLLVTVRRQQAATEVSAVTKIQGQLFDWGKSRSCLDRLFADLQLEPA